MNDTEIRIAIAEHCGWKKMVEGFECVGWLSPKHGRLRFDFVPDYTTDLNAIHEAETIIPDSHYDCWLDNLYRAVGLNPYVWRNKYGDGSTPDIEMGKVFKATARQRAEALLRTLGKWKD